MIRFDRLFPALFLPATIGAAFVLLSPAVAQDFAACTKIANDQQRLACFDRASQAPQSAPVEVPPVNPPVAGSNPFASFGFGDPAPTKVEEFGRASLPVTAPPPRPDEPQPIHGITAQAIKIIDPEGKPTFVLDNNQTWVSVKYIRIVPRSKGPNTVKIESSAIGYLMTLNDSSFQFAVRRLK